MQIVVNRVWYTAKSTCGNMCLDGAFECFTLEPPYDKTQTIKPRAIPAGTYPALLVMSKRFGKQVLQLQGVPGFTAVEIHMGNDAPDTDACTLVGETHSPDWVGTSDAAFVALMQKVTVPGAGPFTVQYVDNLPSNLP
jgi:hypothetical protein